MILRMTPPRPGRVAVLGELLYDVFPDGTAVLGGAPFNVAWHLRGLGADPAMISRVGNDDRGRAALTAMEDWGLSTESVVFDPARATGEVRVTLGPDGPRYEIARDRAWDHVAPEAFLELIERDESVRFLYHGTLGLRGADPRSLFRLADGLVIFKRFVDLNLRDPWWDDDLVNAVLTGATWIKLNEREAERIWGGSDEAVLRDQFDRRHAEAVICTRGRDGATLVDGFGVVHQPAVPAEPFVDEVGAGDAFAAALLAAICRGQRVREALPQAAALAAAVCTRRGALGLAREDYKPFPAV